MNTKNGIASILKLTLPYFITALIAFLIYVPALKYDLTLLDDSSFINDSAVSYETAENVLFKAFTTNVLFDNEGTPFYRPLLSLSFAVEHKIAGESVFLAHLTNILLHCLSCVLVLFFFRRYLSAGNALSLFAAALFALHPSAIQTAAWIPGRNDSLYFIYFMTAFMFFIEYLRQNKISFFALSYLFFILCCFTKESAISIPVIFILYYALADEKKTKIPVYFYLLWIAGIVLFLLAKNEIVPGTGLSFSMIKGFNPENFSMLADHISSVFFLRAPVAAYPSAEIIVSGYILCILFVFTVFFGKSNAQEIKVSLFYLLFTFIMFLPDFIGDRLFFHGNRIYIPFFGIIALFFFSLNSLLLKTKSSGLKITAYIVLCFILTASAAATFQNLRYFKNGAAFWGKLRTDTNSIYLTYDKFYVLSLIEQQKDYGKASDMTARAAIRSKYNDNEVLYLLAYLDFITGKEKESAVILDTIRERNILRSKGILTDIYILYCELGEKEKAGIIYGRIFEYNKITQKQFDKELERARRRINGHKRSGGVK